MQLRKAIVAAAICCTMLSLSPAPAAVGTITTIAGTSVPARTPNLRFPSGLTYDASGSLYFAEWGNHRVRRVDPSAGTTTIVAGTGIAGSNGDGGAAREASLNGPRDVAFDSAGNMYIAEYDGHRIRKVDALGKISTFAGTGSAGYNGDGRPANTAQLSYPAGVTVDADGNVYIADQYNGRIRKVDAAGTISTVAGNGKCGYFGDRGQASSSVLCQPADVWASPGGGLLIADTYNSLIRQISSQGVITTVAGNTIPMSFGDGLAATRASLNWPTQVVTDASGNMLIADTGNHRIRKVDSEGTITTVAGSTTTLAGNTFTSPPSFFGDGGQATSAILNNPAGIAFNPSGGFVIGDSNNHRVRAVSTSGVINTFAGGGGVYGCDFNGDGAATTRFLCMPQGIAVTPTGDVVIADPYVHRVRKLTTAGTLTTFAGNGLAGNAGDGGPAASARLNLPSDVASDGAGNVYVADYGNSRIRKITPAGVISTYASISSPRGIAIDSSGNLYVSSDYSSVYKIPTSGPSTVFAGNYGTGYSGDNGPATGARLNNPAGLSVDSAGNVFIADEGNHVIRKVSTSGIITTVAGTGVRGFSGDGSSASTAQLSLPRDVFVDTDDNIWIADTDNNRVRKVVAGTITTVAGIGPSSSAQAAIAGDGGNAGSARLAYPAAITLKSVDLLISDRFNSRIRKVEGPV